MIELVDVSYTYETGVEAVRGVNLKIEEGTMVAILGENGAGKTTLLKLMAGLLKPTRGRVLVDGVDTRTCKLSQLVKEVALVFQSAEEMFFSETVFEEVAFALRNFGYPEDVVQARVTRALVTMGLDQYADKSPFELSGGEQKRLAMAIVLAWSPKYVLFDEPTAGQDPINKEMIRGVMRQLALQGRTVVMVTHDVDFVFELQPRVVVMKDGRLVADGSCIEVFSDRGLIEEAGLVTPAMLAIAHVVGRTPRSAFGFGELKRWVSEAVKRR